MNEKEIRIWSVDTTDMDLYTYLLSKSVFSEDTKHLIKNIIDWLWYQSMDKEDTTSCLMALLDGLVDIKKGEIKSFIHW